MSFLPNGKNPWGRLCHSHNVANCAAAPDIPQVTTAKQQLTVTRRKAGIRPDEPVELDRFEVMRYH